MSKHDRSDDVDVKLRQKSVSDKVKGKVNEVVGKGRAKLGDLTDNGSEHMKGLIQQGKGKLQQKKGEIEGKVSDDLSVSRDRQDEDDL
ncbi:MAG: CsbD family protein [Gemmatimonadota bacterium]